MQDKGFRDGQWARRYTCGIAPINRFINDLGVKDETGHAPYIPLCIEDPMHSH